MKHAAIVLLLTVVGAAASGQALPAQEDSFNPSLSGMQGDKRFISLAEHVSFMTSNFQVTQMERQIIDLESSECKALLKRDTTALRQLWMRDFTLDKPLNHVIDGNNVLPYYVAINRVIEQLSVAGGMVFTSGYEVVQQLNSSGKLEEPVKQKFFHTWTNRYGTWKMSTKTR